MLCVHLQLRNKNRGGFSLVELLIVMVIMGILAAVGLPLYQDQVTKSRRVDGKTALMNILSIEERYFIRNNEYTDNLGTDLNLNVDTNQDGTTSAAEEAADRFLSEEGFYLITAAFCTTGDSSCVVLTATPQGGQSGDSVLTYNSQGVKTPANLW
ncbi:MAG: prepilin-type N-terminal cleavage/methylation domain-containing protein [Magnetococcales bacterium]|nr:prepilin-type N-terminal cleavage/methylation domain-containing protein [Magnetococcales bacterium]